MSATLKTETVTPPVSTKNLYQRIRAIMEDVEYLQKDKEVSTGGSGSYKALSEETVTKNVRDAMIRHGVVILPIGQEHHLVDHVRGPGKIVSLTTVNTNYKIVNVDNPSEFEILASSGTGVDSQDKGVGKAQTYAYKYLLLRTFGIATGRDADSVGNAELEREQAAAAAKAIENAIKQLDAATTQKEVKEVHVKEYMPNPEYKAATERAVQRVKQAPEAVGQDSATPTPPAAPAASGEGEVQKATVEQRDRIIELLNHPLITKAEKGKMLRAIDEFTQIEAADKIDKLIIAIAEREAAEAA